MRNGLLALTEACPEENLMDHDGWFLEQQIGVEACFSDLFDSMLLNCYER